VQRRTESHGLDRRCIRTSGRPAIGSAKGLVARVAHVRHHIVT
jgi:hypothetical protein